MIIEMFILLIIDGDTLMSFIAVSVEKVLTIVYQPQAVFRIRPVTRCSATIAGTKLFTSLVVMLLSIFSL